MRVFVAQFAEIVANFRSFRISRCNVFLSCFINLYWKGVLNIFEKCFFLNFLKITDNLPLRKNYFQKKKYHVQRVHEILSFLHFDDLFIFYGIKPTREQTGSVCDRRRGMAVSCSLGYRTFFRPNYLFTDD